MQTRTFGAAGPTVPVLGIGTWNMERDDRRSAIRAIRRAIELGMTHVDTAEMYGNGKVETMVGEAIAGVRDQVFLVSKVLPRNASYAGTLRACEAS
ncbi:MAG TPA: aldo/keto reductase, partial [Kofleriaceae bacterium]|nr:aldo/keto reductase [Kofleriaceae bacterium]